jgi:ADP-ribose pyrophosphatase YjhB (NUDIX family)
MYTHTHAFPLPPEPTNTQPTISSIDLPYTIVAAAISHLGQQDILLEKRIAPVQGGTVGLPGGKARHGEPLVSAQLRELHEEISFSLHGAPLQLTAKKHAATLKCGQYTIALYIHTVPPDTRATPTPSERHKVEWLRWVKLTDINDLDLMSSTPLLLRQLSQTTTSNNSSWCCGCTRSRRRRRATRTTGAPDTTPASGGSSRDPAQALPNNCTTKDHHAETTSKPGTGGKPGSSAQALTYAVAPGDHHAASTSKSASGGKSGNAAQALFCRPICSAGWP